jgi:hypothetical protein
MKVQYDNLEYTTEGVFFYQGIPFTGCAVDDSVEGLYSTGTFLDGREHGVAEIRGVNGNLLEEIPYFMGFQHGIRRKWLSDGTLVSVQEIEYGMLMKEFSRDNQKGMVLVYERPQSDVIYKQVLEMREKRQWPFIKK